jgi:hypothetical protein
MAPLRYAPSQPLLLSRVARFPCSLPQRNGEVNRPLRLFTSSYLLMERALDSFGRITLLR